MGLGDSNCFGQLSDSHGITVGVVPLGNGLKIGVASHIPVAATQGRVYFQTDYGEFPVLRGRQQINTLGCGNHPVVHLAADRDALFLEFITGAFNVQPKRRR